MNGDWTLDCGPDGTISFGSQQSKYPLAIAPEIGDADRDNQDSKLTGVDGASFGADTVSGQTDAFGLTAVGDTDEEARALYDEFRRLWRADTIRSTPGAVATLTAPSGRSTFGRPRRITPAFYPPGSAAIGITADFATADDLWYGDVDHLEVQIASSQSGGFVFPMRFPMVARGYTGASNGFVVAGSRPTWPVITIRGQILNPVVAVPGAFTFAAPTSLAYDEWLTIDTRPGRRFVTKNGVQSAKLTRASTLLPSASLRPGAHTMTLTGSTTGSPRARIEWRPAFTTP
ncbi:hypothetical protein [Curtobacterium sp. AB7]|uniref:hypothetical protein n=1 Tax=Curtobacterium sp. AB7 TaxID=3349327 RepID=UPI0038331CEE